MTAEDRLKLKWGLIGMLLGGLAGATAIIVQAYNHPQLHSGAMMQLDRFVEQHEWPPKPADISESEWVERKRDVALALLQASASGSKRSLDTCMATLNSLQPSTQTATVLEDTILDADTIRVGSLVRQPSVVTGLRWYIPGKVKPLVYAPPGNARYYYFDHKTKHLAGPFSPLIEHGRGAANEPRELLLKRP